MDVIAILAAGLTRSNSGAAEANTKENLYASCFNAAAPR
jgi:hypothetical protein